MSIMAELIVKQLVTSNVSRAVAAFFCNYINLEFLVCKY